MATRPLICVNCGSSEQITALCYGDKNIELPETLYLYNKLFDGVPNFQIGIFLCRLFFHYRIFTEKDFFDGGVRTGIPEHFRYILPILKSVFLV